MYLTIVQNKFAFAIFTITVALWLLLLTSRLTAQNNGEAYRIRIGDRVSVKFLYQPELDEPAIAVRPDGMINLSIIDDVQARGLTVAELKGRIEAAYSEMLLNPVVTVNLVEFVPPRVYIVGEVSKPAGYELRSGQTLLQAIAVAGGFTHSANRKLVLLARPVEGDKLRMMIFDAERMISNPVSAKEVFLQDGDYIYIPESRLSKLARVIEAFRGAVPGFGIGIGH